MAGTPGPAAGQWAVLLALLCDPLRLRIGGLLAVGEMCTCHLAGETGAKQTAISHRLRILRRRER